MTRVNHINAIDLGTTKFCVATLSQTHGQTSLKVVDVPAAGMRRGMLSDFTLAKEALGQLIVKAESELQIDIRKVVIGVAGSHLQGRIEQREISIRDPYINGSHIDLLSNLVLQQGQVPQREILHCIPICFSIDNREPIQNPLNFTGQKLMGKFFVIDSDRNYLKDLIRLCNICGLEVVQLYSEPFASASVIVDDKLKHLGIVVADIGGGTTDGIVFQNGRPVDIFTINIAGSLMTKDISLGLNLDLHSAQTLKETYGLATNYGMASPAIKDIHGNSQRIENKDIAAILGPRVSELGAHLANNLRMYKGFLGGGILFTGGGSSLQGLEQFLSQRFQVNVRRARPDLKILSKPDQYPGRYATVIGLLNLEIGRMNLKLNRNANSWPKKYFSQFFNWVKELAD